MACFEQAARVDESHEQIGGDEQAGGEVVEFGGLVVFPDVLGGGDENDGWEAV